jgi:hypothetical protein
MLMLVLLEFAVTRLPVMGSVLAPSEKELPALDEAVMLGRY